MGNGIKGWKQKFLFDAIVISATSDNIPEKLLENLKLNGRLIMPKKYHTGNQKLLLINKKNEKHITRNYSKNQIFQFGDDLIDSVLGYLERLRMSKKKAS